MLSSRDRLEAVLSRLAVPDAPERPTFTVLYPEAARAAADAADARRKMGLGLGPLDGRIVSIKDLFDVAGEVTTAGSKILRDAPPAVADAVVVQRLRRAGAVIVGKTNMSEFAFSGLGVNPHFGTPGNAADRTRVPGGSSSGAGVSVGEGTSEIAIGSDTGGSVRIPAALNGVVGFKSSIGRVPVTGAFPLSYTLDSVGPLARSVADCADADAVMAGLEPAPLPGASLRGLRVGVARGRLFAGVSDEVGAAFEAALATLSRAGAVVFDVAIEDLLDAMAKVMAPAPLAAIEAAAIHADYLDTRAADFDRRVRGRVIMGRAVSAPQLVAMQRGRASLAAAMEARLADIDLLALPTIPVVAPKIADLDYDQPDDTFVATNLLMLRNTYPGNVFDLTGLSLPLPKDGLPAGLQLLSRFGSDRRLLALGAAVEVALKG